MLQLLLPGPLVATYKHSFGTDQVINTLNPVVVKTLVVARNAQLGGRDDHPATTTFLTPSSWSRSAIQNVRRAFGPYWSTSSMPSAYAMTVLPMSKLLPVGVGSSAMTNPFWLTDRYFPARAGNVVTLPLGFVFGAKIAPARSVALRSG
jgi:hypothetical protein